MARLPFYDDMISALADGEEQDIHKLKMRLVREHKLKKIPSDQEILMNATSAERKKITHLVKPVRTQAGVSPIAIMSAPFACPHGKCTFCPDHIKDGVPMSYTGKEPASMRGIRWGFDAYLQTFNRLEQYVVNGHSPQKCDVIVMGGTFPSYPLAYQEGFVRDMFQALNDFGALFFPAGALDVDAFNTFFELPSDVKDDARTERIRKKMLAQKKTRQAPLAEEQRRNERAFIRCIGLTFETRPDCGLLPHGNLLLRLGGTRIELGVQSVYDACLAVTGRAHTTETNKQSIQVLRDLGFKLNFHLMPGLPGADKTRIPFEQDVAGMIQIFEDPAYRPDMVKFYPCMVMPGTALEKDYEAGVFEPMGTDEAVKLLREVYPHIPEYCRIMRVQRDIPTYRTTAGVDKTNLRQLVDTGAVRCRDIRSREVKTEVVDDAAVKIIVREYEASGGKEFFIAAEDPTQDLLVGFCRLRFPGQCLREEITSETALIRELHVYGHSTPLDESGEVQHRGWGSKLLQEAERIAKDAGKENMVIIAGVGVRAYYMDKHGYVKDGPYVSKSL